MFIKVIYANNLKSKELRNQHIGEIRKRTYHARYKFPEAYKTDEEVKKLACEIISKGKERNQTEILLTTTSELLISAIEEQKRIRAKDGENIEINVVDLSVR